MAKAAQKQDANRIQPVMVLAGPELFSRREALDQIRGDFVSENKSDMGYVRLDETSSVLTILDECRTAGMFAPRKLVVVDPADHLFRIRADQDEDQIEDEVAADERVGSTAPRELILRYAEAPCVSSTLVLACTNWLKTTRLHKFLDTRGAIRWCLSLKEEGIPPWLIRRARQAYAREFNPDAAIRLAELIGPDLARLDSELQKLSLYTLHETAISIAAVDALVGFQHEQQVWNLIDAMAAGDAPTALARHDELWQMDLQIGYKLVGAVFYWLSQVLKAREMLDRRLSESQIIRDLKLWPAPRAANIIKLARRWGIRGARRYSAALLATDIAAKTSVGNPRRNMECFIAQLCVS